MTIAINQTAKVEHTRDQHCQKILQFFNKYPFAKFSKLTIAHTINVRNSMGIEEALQQLIDKGLITVQSRNNVSFYNLNEKGR